MKAAYLFTHCGLILIVTVLLTVPATQLMADAITAEQWREVELTLSASASYDNPYTDVEAHVVFTHSEGLEIRRPAFWDGDGVWKARFASPLDSGTWTWRSFASNPDDEGLHGREGELQAAAYQGDTPLIQRGLLRMSLGGRNVIHADGSPFVVVGDTPWALPFRGTAETVTRYARNRQERGFNTALLMSVQPDRRAEGPRDRAAAGGFGVGFEDLPDGRLNQLNWGAKCGVIGGFVCGVVYVLPAQYEGYFTQSQEFVNAQSAREFLERVYQIYSGAYRGDTLNAGEAIYWYALYLAAAAALTASGLYIQSVRQGRRNWFFAFLTLNFVYLCGCLLLGHLLAVTLTILVFVGIEFSVRQRKKSETVAEVCDSENSSKA